MKRKPKKAVGKKTGKKTKVKKHYEPIFGQGFWKTDKRLLSGFVIFLAAFCLYLPVVNYDFILDDKIVYSENDFVKEGVSEIWKILSKETFEGYLGEQDQSLVVGSRYRPLSLVTFAVEYEIFGLNPTIGHIGNGLLYGLTCLLIYRLMFLMFPGVKSRWSEKWYLTIPFVGAMLFALHPVHSEVVANIKGRDEIMALLGALSSLYFAFRYVDRSDWKWLFFSAVSFFLGLLSKENVITFLAVIPAAIYFFTDRPLRKNATITGVLLAVTLLYLLIRMQVIGYLLSNGQEITQLMNNPFVEMNDAQKFATIFLTLGKYIQLLFVPWPLTHDYYPYAIPIQEWTNIPVLISLFLYLAMGVFTLLGIRKKKLYSFWFIYYLSTLSIVSNLFFPVGTFMNERFIYMSSLAFCALAPWLFLYKLPENLPSGSKMLVAGPILLAVAALTYIGITLNRLPDWRSPLALNASAVNANPGSARANLFYGTALFNKYRISDIPDERNRLLNVAEHQFNRAIEIYPTYSSALNMKAGVAAERYREHRDIDRLLHEFTAVMRINPRLSYIREYMEFLNRTFSDKQRLIDFYYQLGVEVLIPEGFLQEAHFYINMGYELDPESADMNYAMFRILEARGQPNNAHNYWIRAIELDPGIRNRLN
ncbi:MAG: hypothetical protein EA409_01460 [Saprospirales bacterium]|nr:MAG: hypothetical protein EA409_01460 [Saprospirales bacterium]